MLDKLGKGKNKLARLAKGAGKFLKFAGPIPAAIATAYSGFDGYQNTNQNFDLGDKQEATTGQKISSTLGGIASGLSFGLVDEKSAAQGIHGLGSKIGD